MFPPIGFVRPVLRMTPASALTVDDLLRSSGGTIELSPADLLKL